MARLREAPAGVLVLVGLLGLMGCGLMLGGSYLALARGNVGWMVWTAAVAVGPLLLYFAAQLLRLAHWAWLTMVILLGMLLVSSLARTASTPHLPLAPLAEIAGEALVLTYLLRGEVRRSFRRGRPLSR